MSKRNKADPLAKPIGFKPFVYADNVWLEWSREPGLIDGFVIYGGSDLDNLGELKRIPSGFKRSYIEKIVPKENTFFSIASFRGEQIGEKLNPITIRLNSDIQVIPKNKVREIAGTVVRKEARREDVAIASCGYCGAVLEFNEEEKVFVCSSCHAKHVQRLADQKFIPIDILKNGICECCSPRRPLIKANHLDRIICSGSGEAYINNGQKLIRISDLDYGLCACCNPPNALILNHQGQIVCSLQLDHLYEKRNGVYVYHPPETINFTLDDIDRALSDGSAIMLPGGVLSVE